MTFCSTDVYVFLINSTQSADYYHVEERGADENTRTVEPQKVIGERFEVLEVLGKGAAGAIYKVIDRHQSNREVALKILRNTEAFDENTLQRFLEEINICSELRHVNIVEAYEYIKLPDGIAFTMEVVEGDDLSKIIRERTLSYDEIDTIFVQILRGLGELHRQGIIHRDIKLENILVTPDLSTKLADLGLIKRLDDTKGLTRTGILLGTAQYMPPEYVRSGVYDERSDIYALGLALYEVLSGKRWLIDLKGMDALDHLIKTKFKVPVLERTSRGRLPDKYKTILAKALDGKPRKRYHDAYEMIEDFECAEEEFFQANRSAGVRRDRDPPTQVLKRGVVPKEQKPAGNAKADVQRFFFGFWLSRILGAAAVASILLVLWVNIFEAPKLHPGSYAGELFLDGESPKSISAEISGQGIFVVLNLSGCRSGFVNQGSGAINCGESGFVFSVKKTSENKFSGEIKDTNLNKTYRFTLEKVRSLIK